MFVTEDRTVITSPSDLKLAAECEFAFVRHLDARLGLGVAPPHDDDPMLRRAGTLGDDHEQQILERLRREHEVVEIPRPATELPAIRNAVAATKAALLSGADVVFQGAFFDGQLLGYADFLVRQPDGRYQVQDSKLARSAKVTALLQLAAYAEQLEQIGVGVDPTAVLILGDGTVSEHALDDVVPVFRERRAHLRRIVAARLADVSPVAWGDPRVAACGRCVVCEPEVEAAQDLLLVAGLRATTRARLMAEGITTVERLARSEGPVEGVAASTLGTLRHQAALQLRALPGEPPPFEIVDPSPVAALPAPDAGDIFFDFEGDPLHSEPGEQDETRWGLDYLFGLVEGDGTFRSFWAHSLAEEGAALRAFLDYVAERRAKFPGMHVYHYAPYERTHLAAIAARHGVGEEEVDDLLRTGVLVDLYPVVRSMLRVGDRSYSLKTIEKLFHGAGRAGDVTTGADSVEEYARARALRQEGQDEAADELLAQIAAYNEEDCLSTLQLRDWLVARAKEHGVVPGTAKDDETAAEPPGGPAEEDPLALELRQLAGEPSVPGRTPDARALGLMSAAVDYFRREDKSFWWGHFDRLSRPWDDWADTRDVLIVDEARVEADWHTAGPRQNPRRHLRLRGELAPGSTLKAGDKDVYLVYPKNGPPVDPRTAEGQRQSHNGTLILEVDDSSILVAERLRTGLEEYHELPLAVAPAPPPSAGSLSDAIRGWAENVLQTHPRFPEDAVVDILRRTPPRTRSGRGLAPATEPDGTIDAILASLADLGSSYIAVQGPPGTGKTYTGAHVIARLVEQGWKIGVVAQSHATVENMLEAVLEAGVDPRAVGKKPRKGASRDTPWQALSDTATRSFLDSDEGRVLGGTAWTFSNTKQVARRELDLLVIDEAGQFSLAHTIAAGVSARNLLLLGDPQQLPQVSQGIHPEPVDGSALGWITDGHDVLPDELGYFLPTSRRMTGPLAQVVSELSYEGELSSHPTADARHLDGVGAGVHPVPVEHTGSATESAEESARVVGLVRELLGATWSDPGDTPAERRLGEDDIIVVAPYNAQVKLVSDTLLGAGLGDVRVGTVDKFQGQQAVIAIVTLAASSPDDVPRGMEFLIMRNRINVAISRAQWAAYVVHSPALVDYLPRTPGKLAELSAFLRVVRPAPGRG